MIEDECQSVAASPPPSLGMPEGGLPTEFRKPNESCTYEIWGFQTRSDKSVPMACICESQVSIVYRDLFWKLALLEERGQQEKGTRNKIDC